MELLGKKNQDGSYSVSMSAGDLVAHAFVDFYDDATGNGYQRRESTRARRGREIADYIERCTKGGLPPRLFELTACARMKKKEVRFEGLDDEGTLGFLELTPSKKRSLSVIDGGTRLLGIESALARGVIAPEFTFDVRVFAALSIAEEIAQFLLINEKQKRVRTDLSLRVVQRKLDEHGLNDREKNILKTVVPESDSWRFDASRIAGLLNSEADSPWLGLVQMPNDKVGRPVKLQAFFTSLKPLLTHPDLSQQLKKMARDDMLQVRGKPVDPAVFLQRVLINFWNAVRLSSPRAHDEPSTNVLWGSIGVNACHLALAPIMATILGSQNAELTERRFKAMLADSKVGEDAFWFSRPGSKQKKEMYPGEKGEACAMTGAANYVRLGRDLEQEWRAALHSQAAHKVALA